MVCNASLQTGFNVTRKQPQVLLQLASFSALGDLIEVLEGREIVGTVRVRLTPADVIVGVAFIPTARQTPCAETGRARAACESRAVAAQVEIESRR
jgi:hypothetical protein